MVVPRCRLLLRLAFAYHSSRLYIVKSRPTHPHLPPWNLKLEHQAQQMRALFQSKQLALRQKLQAGQISLAQAQQISQMQQVDSNFDIS